MSDDLSFLDEEVSSRIVQAAEIQKISCMCNFRRCRYCNCKTAECSAAPDRRTHCGNCGAPYDLPMNSP